MKSCLAASYHEKHEGGETNTREDFERIIGLARRDFDGKNFGRDLGNAKTRGLINKGPGNTVSYKGQKYVDKLPDRKAAKAMLRGGGRPKKKKKATKA